MVLTSSALSISWLSLGHSRCAKAFQLPSYRGIQRAWTPHGSHAPTRCAYTTSSSNALSIAENAFSVLARKKRTWKRLRHLVDLAQETKVAKPKTIVDIGCDHGILPIAMAATGRFEKVLGIDVSERVLRDGAMKLHKEVEQYLESVKTSAVLTPVEFRLGDGLTGVETGDADVVCVAGMGVNTMLKIVASPETDRVGCQLLLLQPTNSKPKNLVLLYDTLQNTGWELMGERIEFLSSRWYLSVAFAKRDERDIPVVGKTHLPGVCLRQLGDTSPMKETFDRYIKHHKRWLEKDKDLPQGLAESEERWLEAHTCTTRPKQT